MRCLHDVPHKDGVRSHLRDAEDRGHIAVDQDSAVVGRLRAYEVVRPEHPVILRVGAGDLDNSDVTVLCDLIVEREHTAFQRLQLALLGALDFLPFGEGHGFLFPVRRDIRVQVGACSRAGKDGVADGLTCSFLLIAQEQSRGVHHHVVELLVAGLRVEHTVGRLFPSHLALRVVELLIAGEVRRRVRHDDRMRVVLHLAEMIPHIQRAVAHAAEQALRGLKLSADALDVLFTPVVQVAQDVMEILVPCALRCPQIDLRVQSYGRV